MVPEGSEVIELTSPATTTTATSGEGQWDSESQEHDGCTLPPADRGLQAWLFLLSAFMIEGTVWGFPFAFGVFQNYYSTHEPFSKDSSGIAAIGTTATGVMYLGAPLVQFFYSSFPGYQRVVNISGLVLIEISLVAASFANNTWQLLVTQGILYAIGGMFLYYLAIMYLDQWFIQRQGLAFGIMWGGGGAAGVIIPILLEWLLSQYGFRTTLRVWAIVMFFLATPSVYFLRPRLPIQHSRHGIRRVDLTFTKSSTFLILQAGTIIQGVGYFIPSYWLPTYSRAIGLSHLSGTATVALFNFASVIGAVSIGALCDHFHVTTAILISTVGATISLFVGWGLAVSLAPVLVFALFYGIFGGGFSATWPGCATSVKTKYRGAETGMVISMLAAGKGIGAVASGPLSEKLLEVDSWRGKLDGAYGTGYGLLVLVSGISMVLGGVGWAGRRFGWVL